MLQTNLSVEVQQWHFASVRDHLISNCMFSQLGRIAEQSCGSTGTPIPWSLLPVPIPAGSNPLRVAPHRTWVQILGEDGRRHMFISACLPTVARDGAIVRGGQVCSFGRADPLDVSLDVQLEGLVAADPDEVRWLEMWRYRLRCFDQLAQLPGHSVVEHINHGARWVVVPAAHRPSSRDVTTLRLVPIGGGKELSLTGHDILQLRVVRENSDFIRFQSRGARKGWWVRKAGGPWGKLIDQDRVQRRWTIHGLIPGRDVSLSYRDMAEFEIRYDAPPSILDW